MFSKRYLFAWLCGLPVIMIGVHRAGGDGPVVVPKEPPRVYALLYVTRQGGEAESAAFRERQQGMLLGRFVQWYALQDAKVCELPSVKKQKDSVGWLSRYLKADFLGSTGVLVVALSDGTPQEQAVIVNAVVRAYLDKAINMEKKIRLRQQKKSLATCLEMLHRDEKNLPGIPDKPNNKNEVRQRVMDDIARNRATANRIQASIAKLEAELRAPPRVLLLEEAAAPKR